MRLFMESAVLCQDEAAPSLPWEAPPLLPGACPGAGPPLAAAAAAGCVGDPARDGAADATLDRLTLPHSLDDRRRPLPAGAALSYIGLLQRM